MSRDISALALGLIAYEGFAERCAWFSLETGQPMPQWPDLSEGHQQVWIATASAVRDAVLA